MKPAARPCCSSVADAGRRLRRRWRRQRTGDAPTPVGAAQCHRRAGLAGHQRPRRGREPRRNAAVVQGRRHGPPHRRRGGRAACARARCWRKSTSPRSMPSSTQAQQLDEQGGARPGARRTTARRRGDQPRAAAEPAHAARGRRGAAARGALQPQLCGDHGAVPMAWCCGAWPRNTSWCPPASRC